MTNKNHNIDASKSTSVVQATFGRSSYDENINVDREEILEELFEAYSSLEMLAANADYDSKHPADVMRALNRLFGQTLQLK